MAFDVPHAKVNRSKFGIGPAREVVRSSGGRVGGDGADDLGLYVSHADRTGQFLEFRCQSLAIRQRDS